eukprot:m.481480 g.481480  ORF g.481480 m.481480 type:complete len:651 (+) comp22179_c0_seq1:58-2010(+)
MIAVVVAAALAVVSFGHGATAHDDVVLAPPANQTGSDVVFIFAQGAQIKTEAYLPFAHQLQQALPYRLWVAIPQCAEDLCVIPGTLSAAVDRAKQRLVAKGANASAPVIYSGHSLGGSQIPAIVNASVAAGDHTAAGMVLMGSFLPRTFKTARTPEGRPQVYFPLPVLTIGGELDGLCRMPRMAEAFYSQIDFAADPTRAARSQPVVVIEGMSHMQFASGTPPITVRLNDLRPEISNEAARAQTVQITAGFIHAILSNNSTAWNTVDAAVKNTSTLVGPVIESLNMEGYSNFLPPCYCESKDEFGKLEYGTCQNTPSCRGSVPWTEQTSQRIVAGVDTLPGLQVTVADSIHLVTEEKPSCHLPFIHSSQYSNVSDPNDIPGNGKFPPLCQHNQSCTLHITTVTQPVYGQVVNSTSEGSERSAGGGADIAVFGTSTLSFLRRHGLSRASLGELFSPSGLFGLDTGFGPISASELRTKLKSRQTIWEAAGIAGVNLTQSDQPKVKGGLHDLCGEINQAAWDWAKKTASPSAMARYQKIGQPLVIGADKTTCYAGPCWIYDPLVMHNDREGNRLTVQSIVFVTRDENDFPCAENEKGHLPCDSGMHYCKVLSPARALEWIYVDGLRLHGSINNKTHTTQSQHARMEQHFQRQT